MKREGELSQLTPDPSLLLHTQNPGLPHLSPEPQSVALAQREREGEAEQRPVSPTGTGDAAASA